MIVSDLSKLQIIFGDKEYRIVSTLTSKNSKEKVT